MKDQLYGKRGKGNLANRIYIDTTSNHLKNIKLPKILYEYYREIL